jgi:BirA family transcriptional regulator, biotin operon repressor / biotin---[acetyl-CoA-carboxylase] ligase
MGFAMDVIRVHFETIDSTNNWAKHHSHTLAHDKITLVTATMQTAGRGRFKRRWESPAGQNIYASFCFFVEKHRHDICNIPQVMAISVAQTLEDLGFQSQLKWPNDILLSKKKVAGILAETTPLSDYLCVVIGIGLNINMPVELLQKIDRPATSLMVEGGQSLSVEEVLEKLQNHFVKNLELFFEEGFRPFLEEYKQRLDVDSKLKLRFDDNKTVWEGYFHSIGNDGSLNLLMENGEIKNFLVGEILW